MTDITDVQRIMLRDIAYSIRYHSDWEVPVETKTVKDLFFMGLIKRAKNGDIRITKHGKEALK